MFSKDKSVKVTDQRTGETVKDDFTFTFFTEDDFAGMTPPDGHSIGDLVYYANYGWDLVQRERYRKQIDPNKDYTAADYRGLLFEWAGSDGDRWLEIRDTLADGRKSTLAQKCEELGLLE